MPWPKGAQPDQWPTWFASPLQVLGIGELEMLIAQVATGRNLARLIDEKQAEPEVKASDWGQYLARRGAEPLPHHGSGTRARALAA